MLYIFIPAFSLHHVMTEVVEGIDTYTKASYVYWSVLNNQQP